MLNHPCIVIFAFLFVAADTLRVCFDVVLDAAFGFAEAPLLRDVDATAAAGAAFSFFCFGDEEGPPFSRNSLNWRPEKVVQKKWIINNNIII